MFRQPFLHRCPRPRFNTYITDGLGRDTYISFNNGGFFVKNMKEIKYRPNYPVFHKINYHTLAHSAAPFSYRSDGSGRDSYILDHDGGLKRDDKPLSQFRLTDFLRTPESCIYNFQNNKTKSNGVRYATEFVSKREFENNNKLWNIQKGIIKRLYRKPMEKIMMESSKSPGKNNTYIPYLRAYMPEDTESKIWKKKNKNEDAKDLLEKNNKAPYEILSYENRNNRFAKTMDNFYRMNPNLSLPKPKRIKKLSIDVDASP